MLGKNLLILLEKNDLSLSKLSRDTNVPKSNLSAWLKGRSPNIEQLDVVAQYFGVSIEFLMFGRKNLTNEPTLMYRAEVEDGKYEIIFRKISE
jgi:transcriptional regulator with XRE-family HTH domain